MCASQEMGWGGKDSKRWVESLLFLFELLTGHEPQQSGRAVPALSVRSPTTLFLRRDAAATLVVHGGGVYAGGVTRWRALGAPDLSQLDRSHL